MIYVSRDGIEVDAVNRVEAAKLIIAVRLQQELSDEVKFEAASLTEKAS